MYINICINICCIYYTTMYRIEKERLEIGSIGIFKDYKPIEVNKINIHKHG